MTNINKYYSIEKFRETLIANLIAKGIIPPKENSAEEHELYQKWLKGAQKLINNQSDK